MAFDEAKFSQLQSSALKPTSPADTGSFDSSKFDTLMGGTGKTTINKNVFVPQAAIKTKPGLVSLSNRAGLGSKAEAITKNQGEDPEKIFSGGFISDVFDSLNLLQHGVTGTLQGMGFAKGVETRASFTKEKDLKDAGIPGLVAGVALDIAVDPLTYINPASALGKIGKVTGLSKVVEGGLDAASKTKIGQKLGDMFIYQFGADPVFKQMFARMELSKGLQNKNIADMAKIFRTITPETRKFLTTTDATGATIRKPLEEIIASGKLDSKQLGAVKGMYNTIDNLSKQMVEYKVLPKDIYENLGKYLKNSFEAYETGKVPKAYIAGAKPLRFDKGILTKRKDIPQDVRDALGQIYDSGFLLPDTAIKMVNTVENAKFFDGVFKNFASFERDGFTKLPDEKTLGRLAGQFVPDPIYKAIQEMAPKATKFEEYSKPIVGAFKYGKVILNPATHIRNVLSNLMLNNFEGLSPARLDIYAKAAKEIKTNGKLYQEAQQVGLGLNTYAAREIRSILDGPADNIIKQFGKKGKDALEKISDIYQKEEEWAKMAQYIFQRGKGLSPEDAMKVAERATFNYAQVTPFIRKLRDNAFGFPFVTFTYKSTPQALKTIATKPGRVSWIGKVKNGIENQAGIGDLQKERASEPDWVKDGFFMKLPIKDKYGRSAYFDLTYIIPFGDMVSGNYFERATDRETGLPETAVQAALSKSPAFNAIKELAKNQDFFGNPIVKKSDSVEKQLGDVMLYLTKTMTPPLVGEQIPVGYDAEGNRRPGNISRVAKQEAAPAGTTKLSRTPIEELFRSVGLKISPIDIEEQQRVADFNQKKAIQAMLKEEGVLEEKGILYTPKGR